ncbi:sodium:solute symporter family protein [Massilia sp. TS11]|uniref:sodium:solute symporter family protein n=1 Tax=Massilia sp. TS11 TaxID=2908003 RepID=UPI001EDBA758|nr:sodium:solute symporter family protein [Massilia sp. TS11]MCG2586456.1 cation acetate symporter [Massilia sp. TS11]
MSRLTYAQRLARYYLAYTACFAGFLAALFMLEREGMPRQWIGYLFMAATIGLYATIGVISRTGNVSEYYVAGRRVPAFFNGMATAADWISAASFISLAGGLYAYGFDGLAYIMGWTGGYVLVALLIGPYLRKFAQYTIPDFLGVRYGGGSGGAHHLVRMMAVGATIIVCFTYVVAQIYAVGLIASRFTGVDFSVGVFLGLASILVCSFLGGMRAITWTQVAQYIIIVVAFLLPTMWLSAKHTGNPLPQVAYGSLLPQLAAREAELALAPREEQVRTIYRNRAEELGQRIARLPASWEQGRLEVQRRLDHVRQHNGSLVDIRRAERELLAYPKSAEEAASSWREAQALLLGRAQPPQPHAQPFAAPDRAGSDIRRNNFLALVLCLMLGTAALPHILMRSYTTPSVAETRVSVFWTLFFILLIYLCIPALAVLVKFDLYTQLVGSPFAELPGWVNYWANVDKAAPLISVADVNGDGIIQLAEIAIDTDVLVLATPEIGGLPYVISGLVAAGGLAAALSTADGLLLAISNALSHDIYFKIVDPQASTQKRVTISKLLLLGVAFIAAYVASQRPADILSLVGVAFSLAASTLFPALVLGVFWRRANRAGAVAGMLAGFLTCLWYLLHTLPQLGGSAANQWFHIAPISAGIFGVPAGLLALVVVSLLTVPPDRNTDALVDYLRAPEGERLP